MSSTICQCDHKIQAHVQQAPMDCQAVIHDKGYSYRCSCPAFVPKMGPVK